MQVTATPFMSATPRLVSNDASIAPQDADWSQRRRRRPKSGDGWSPGGFNTPRPGANLPPNHPMHPNNRRMAAVGAADTGARSLGETSSLVEDQEARRRRRGKYHWPVPASQRPGANLPPNHPMHPDNRRRWEY